MARTLKNNLTAVIIKDISNYVIRQHIMRYIFASKLVKGYVLDVACGTGYGTVYLSPKCDHAVGVDISKKALNIATSRNSRSENVSFILADATELPFSDNKFDTVISFETIEHIKDYQKFLMEIKRVLKPNGIFVCSTPNVKYTQHPIYHIKEFYPDEFFRVIQKFFSEVECYGQYISVNRAIKDTLSYAKGKK